MVLFWFPSHTVIVTDKYLYVGGETLELLEKCFVMKPEDFAFETACGIETVTDPAPTAC